TTRALRQAFDTRATDYQLQLWAHHAAWLPFLNDAERQQVQQIAEQAGFRSIPLQVEETMARYDAFSPIVQKALTSTAPDDNSRTQRLDRILTHRLWGPLIFLGLMVLVFQAIFSWAGIPSDAIEALFGFASDGVENIFPSAWWRDLITEGILAGLAGVLVFVPQIAILFLLITLLEEVGYMARAAYMFDRLMQSFGLNGRSLVALISSGACAIPAIMSTRTIANWKERLTTILVAPFISCSARIPVYVVLIGFVISEEVKWGWFNAQGLAFFGLYLLGIVAALLTALLFKYVLKSEAPSHLLLELPEYRRPLMRNVGFTVWEKVRTFVVEAGKVIFVISIILWGLANYGPSERMAAAEQNAQEQIASQDLTDEEAEYVTKSLQLEASFAGQLGHLIEPVIRPLGFDWKMGIAIITSFAAREVFAGTMATLYTISDESDEQSIAQRMGRERDPITGEKVYNTATSASLIIFYVFAMMCMSTLAVVKRETKSWRWPIFQFVFMTGLAYGASWITYAWLS
ncbi:MAG: ferrous iron transport protein B, partial [Bacteroidota bacterium]